MRQTKVLIIGSGGREHAIAWTLARSPRKPQLWCAPGNPGIARVATSVPIAATDIEALAAFVEEEGIDLTVVGPEAPLLAGIADEFQRRGLAIVGPLQAAALLEGSKSFAKRVMNRAGVPTAAHEVFDDVHRALDYVEQVELPIVIKADGLAAGKGVIIAHEREEARAALQSMMVDTTFGSAGARVVIEQFMYGEEATVMALVSGGVVRVLASSRDHKRAFDGDEGPNTGGMGACSPAPGLSDSELAEIERTILRPVVDLLLAEGVDYRGVLYAGLMLGEQGPRVVEFNARFGDPETQAVLPRLNSDLLDLLEAVAHGTLADVELEWTREHSVCVVVAADGYPDTPRTGMPIVLPGVRDDAIVFHAGTTMSAEGELLVSGGRVLGVTALGADTPSAAAAAYAALTNISFDGSWYRSDIAAGARVATPV